MECERIASEGSPVLFTDGSGGSSSGAAGNFHSFADGAGVIASTDLIGNPGGWHYVTNSERGSSLGGGMYCYLLP